MTGFKKNRILTGVDNFNGAVVSGTQDCDWTANPWRLKGSSGHAFMHIILGTLTSHAMASIFFSLQRRQSTPTLSFCLNSLARTNRVTLSRALSLALRRWFLTKKTGREERIVVFEVEIMRQVRLGGRAELPSSVLSEDSTRRRLRGGRTSTGRRLWIVSVLLMRRH